MHALTFSRFGGPEVLEWREVPDPVVTPGSVLVRTEAIGLNFADVYRRRGTYHLVGEPPYIAGYEGAGVVVSVGTGVPHLAIGDRVAFADVPLANAELVLAREEHLVPLPAAVSTATAAAMLLQGLTAHYLTHDSFPVGRGTTMLVHAAAGGVGQLLVQVGTILGAAVFAVVSSRQKADVASALGAKEVWIRQDNEEGWVDGARALTKGGVDVVYDSVGTTLLASLAAARVGGSVVFYGMAGGDPPAVSPRLLMDRSLALIGGDLWNVLVSGTERQRRASALFAWIEQGKLSVAPPRTFRLADGADAHRALEGRGTTGKILLIP